MQVQVHGMRLNSMKAYIMPQTHSTRTKSVTDWRMKLSHFFERHLDMVAPMLMTESVKNAL